MQLNKEMQLALHPEHGQAEIRALEKDVQRAELRLSALRAAQQRLQADLSNAIAKRETCVLKVPHPGDFVNTLGVRAGSYPYGLTNVLYLAALACSRLTSHRLKQHCGLAARYDAGKVSLLVVQSSMWSNVILACMSGAPPQKLEQTGAPCQAHSSV